MQIPALLRPMVAIFNLPVGRLADVDRTWDLTLPPSDARAVVRGAIGTDPYYLPAGEGMKAALRSPVVGNVDDQGRLEIYVGGKYASGLGLVGTITAQGSGSRIAVKVGWTGQAKWLVPPLNLLVLAGPTMIAYNWVATYTGLPRLREDGLTTGEWAALAALFVALWALRLLSMAQTAREDELPRVFGCIDRVLAPHLRKQSASE